jgi:methylphosphotriester-DNA--protein-cysteine methyltransferase
MLNASHNWAFLVPFLSVAASSVCHLFCEQMKISPKQYILQKKLALAGKLIHDGVPPTIAAIRIGYDNYSDFYRMYVKHFKKMPSQYKINQMH